MRSKLIFEVIGTFSLAFLGTCAIVIMGPDIGKLGIAAILVIMAVGAPAGGGLGQTTIDASGQSAAPFAVGLLAGVLHKSGFTSAVT